MELIVHEKRPALEAWLAERFGADHVRIDDVDRLGGGAVSENLALVLQVDGGPMQGWHEAVLRAAAAMGVDASLSKTDEFAVLRAACQAGVAAPEPLAVCLDAGLIGRPFYLMRRAEGVASGHVLVKADEPLRALARQLGRELGKLHRVRPGAAGLECLPPLTTDPARKAIATFRGWAGAEAGRDPVLAYGLRWLERNIPARQEVALCHGDFRTGNYLVQDGRLTAILDWEFAGWSDPMEDLAWFCARSWRFGRMDREAGGIADRADLYAGYEESAGRAVDPVRVAYWETAAYVRWAIMSVQQGRRHTSGVEPSLQLALTGRMRPEIEHDLLLHLDALEGMGV
ncbi:phosphotransferase family protein [Azospirillum griseum]|uniref:Phosphotransferase family protein n=1 Tax=Azospirillum griseum TaxID=2496639 RepID=A0A431VA53_9PROT|nr:phosphotransferase family protein [Azospirillum griseum]RTR13035.1 phosphotransferase family protein [Azospirillum griseum]